jgi:hypothetical protein
MFSPNGKFILVATLDDSLVWSINLVLIRDTESGDEIVIV